MPLRIKRKKRPSHDQPEAAPPVMPTGPVPLRMPVIAACKRCGARHEGVVFKPLRYPIGDYTHWAMCPDTHEPMLLRNRK